MTKASMDATLQAASSIFLISGMTQGSQEARWIDVSGLKQQKRYRFSRLFIEISLCVRQHVYQHFPYKI